MRLQFRLLHQRRQRSDADGFYEKVLRPLELEGLCTVEDPPCDCPEYDEGYYATFFFDPDGLKFEFVINPQYENKRRARMDRTSGTTKP
jgi:hypothetical protein